MSISLQERICHPCILTLLMKTYLFLITEKKNVKVTCPKFQATFSKLVCSMLYIICVQVTCSQVVQTNHLGRDGIYEIQWNYRSTGALIKIVKENLQVRKRFLPTAEYKCSLQTTEPLHCHIEYITKFFFFSFGKKIAENKTIYVTDSTIFLFPFFRGAGVKQINLKIEFLCFYAFMLLITTCGQVVIYGILNRTHKQITPPEIV